MKFALTLFLALFAAGALAEVTELPADAIVSETELYSPEAQLTEGEQPMNQAEEEEEEDAFDASKAEHEHAVHIQAHKEAKATVDELMNAKTNMGGGNDYNSNGGAGGWGGSCTCPDGKVYWVGDNGNYCGSLACHGGKSGTCNKSNGKWSKGSVKCAPYRAPKDQCKDLAKATKKEVTDSVAANQKVVADMPNGSQCKDKGAPLITKANDDKTKADNAESDALKKLNDAKGAQIEFGKFTVSSLKEGQCGSFFNTQVWKDAKNKIKNAETAHTKAKTKAKDAAKAVTTAKDEAAKIVKKCQCDSKKAIEKAIKDMNDKAKASNTAAWNKGYHMDCVLAGTAVNACKVPALPTVQPVAFGAGVKDACSGGSGGDSPLGGRAQCSPSSTVQCAMQCGTSFMGRIYRTGKAGQDWKYGCFLGSFVPAQRKGQWGAEVKYGYGEYSNTNTGQSAMWGLRHIKKDEKATDDHRYQKIDYALYCSNAQGQGARMYAYENGGGHQLGSYKCVDGTSALLTRIVIEPDNTVTYWGRYGGQWQKMGHGVKKAENKDYVLDTSIYGGRLRLDGLQIIHSDATSGYHGFKQVNNGASDKFTKTYGQN
jgi:hypothetical protein